MYIDNPGVYINAFGNDVPEALAAGAGFDVERLGKLRVRHERMAMAKEAIEAELGMAEAERNVKLERAGFKLLDLGLERYHIEDPDGNLLTPMPVPESIAMTLLNQLSPEKAAMVGKGPEPVTAPGFSPARKPLNPPPPPAPKVKSD